VTDTLQSTVAPAQVIVGRDSLVFDAQCMKNDKRFVNALPEVIRKQGAMNKLNSDGAAIAIGIIKWPQ
jgi:hypothetical protein